jgi:hypothetical protein
MTVTAFAAASAVKKKKIYIKNQKMIIKKINKKKY